MCYQANGYDRCTQIHRASVPHETLCRMQIPNQESQTAACKCHCKNRHLLQGQQHTNHCHQQHIHHGNRSAKSINAISQIDCIGQIQNYNQHQWIIEPRNIKREEREIQSGIPIAQPVLHAQPSGCNDNLQDDFLHRGKPIIFLLYDFFKVINESNQTKQNCKNRTAEHLCPTVQVQLFHTGYFRICAEAPIQSITNADRNGRRENEQDPAHSWCSLFFGVPFWPELHFNRLSEF